MRKFLWTILLFTFLFLATSAFAKSAYAASLKFDVPSVSTEVNKTFQVQVIVDSGTEEINSVDAYVKFDSATLEAQSVSSGDFFPTVFNDITSGKVYVAGLVDQPATSKTGTGTVATITFKAKSEGATTLTYECDPSVNKTSKVIKNDFDSTNIIVCSENGSTAVTVAGGTTTEPTATPAPAGDGGGGGTTGGGGTGGGTTPSTLPESGVFDNIVKYAVPGMILLMVGGILKFLL